MAVRNLRCMRAFKVMLAKDSMAQNFQKEVLISRLWACLSFTIWESGDWLSLFCLWFPKYEYSIFVSSECNVDISAPSACTHMRDMRTACFSCQERLARQRILQLLFQKRRKKVVKLAILKGSGNIVL